MLRCSRIFNDLIARSKSSSNRDVVFWGADIAKAGSRSLSGLGSIPGREPSSVEKSELCDEDVVESSSEEEFAVFDADVSIV
jgi:hypothetical protein